MDELVAFREILQDILVFMIVNTIKNKVLDAFILELTPVA